MTADKEPNKAYVSFLDKVTSLTWARLLYFTLFASFGFTGAYQLLYFRRVGLSNAEIGLLIGLQPILSLIAGPAWSLLADRLGIRKRLLSVLLACSVIPTLLLGTTSEFGWLIFLTALGSLIGGPIQPLMDSVTMDLLGQDKHKYGTIRSFGSLSFGITAYATGLLLSYWDIRFIFIACGAFAALAALISTRLQTEDVVLRTSIGRGLGKLVRAPGWITLMIGVFFTMGLQGVAFSYFTLYMDELGASEAMIGLWQAIPSMGNVLMMSFILPGRIQKWGSERLLVLAVFFFALRFAGWTLAPSVAVAGIINILTMITFPPAFLAAVDCAARYAPKGLEATSQALVTGLISMLGRSALTSFAGSLYDTIGVRNMYGACALMAAILTIILAIIWRKRIFVRIEVE